MKDFIGRELKKDDEVVFIVPYYRNLVKGVVVNPTTKGAYVMCTEQDHQFGTKTFRASNQIMKVIR